MSAKSLPDCFYVRPAWFRRGVTVAQVTAWLRGIGFCLATHRGRLIAARIA